MINTSEVGQVKTDCLFDIWLKQIKRNPKDIVRVPEALLNDRKFWFEVLIYQPNLVKHLPDELKTDLYLLKKAATMNNWLLHETALKGLGTAFMVSVIFSNHNAFNHMPRGSVDKDEFVLAVSMVDAESMVDFDKTNDYSRSLHAVFVNGEIFKHLGEEVQENKTIALFSIAKARHLNILTRRKSGFISNPAYVHADAQSDRKERVRLCGELYRQEYNLETANDEILIKHLSSHGYALIFMKDKVKNNERMVSVALSNFGCAIRDVGMDLQDDFKLMCTAIIQCPWSLQFAPKPMRENQELQRISLIDDKETREFECQQFLKGKLVKRGKTGVTPETSFSP